MAGKKALLVIASKNFRDEELFETKTELEKAGIECIIASNSLSEAVGMLGGKAKPEVLIDKANAEGFDAIVFVGGTGSTVLFNNRFAIGLAQKFHNAGKLTAAICLAPSILANAGLLKGKKATVYASEENNLKDKGANYTGKDLEADGLIITANGPHAAKAFGKKIAEMLKQ